MTTEKLEFSEKPALISVLELTELTDKINNIEEFERNLILKKILSNLNNLIFFESLNIQEFLEEISGKLLKCYTKFIKTTKEANTVYFNTKILFELLFLLILIIESKNQLKLERNTVTSINTILSFNYSNVSLKTQLEVLEKIKTETLVINRKDFKLEIKEIERFDKFSGIIGFLFDQEVNCLGLKKYNTEYIQGYLEYNSVIELIDSKFNELSENKIEILDFFVFFNLMISKGKEKSFMDKLDIKEGFISIIELFKKVNNRNSPLIFENFLVLLTKMYDDLFKKNKNLEFKYKENSLERNLIWFLKRKISEFYNLNFNLEDNKNILKYTKLNRNISRSFRIVLFGLRPEEFLDMFIKVKDNIKFVEVMLDFLLVDFFDLHAEKFPSRLDRFLFVIEFTSNSYEKISEFYFNSIYNKILIYLERSLKSKQNFFPEEKNIESLYGKFLCFAEFYIKLNKKFDAIKDNQTKKKQKSVRTEENLTPTLYKIAKNVEFIFGIKNGLKIRGIAKIE